MRLLILTNSLDCLGENDAVISNAFRRFGCEVVLGEVNAISADDYRHFTRGVLLEPDGGQYDPGSAAVGNREAYFLDECQLIWVMTGPQHRVARDVWQMLWLASQRTTFVNSVEGMLFLDTKHALGHTVPKENRAFSYISNDFSLLWERYRHDRDQWWVAKPPNASSGENVFLLPPKGPNARAILQCLTRTNFEPYAITPVSGLRGFKVNYAVLQKFIPEVAQGEKRVLVTCGTAVAWYGRQRHPDDHRSNIRQGAKPISVDLHSGEIELVELIGRQLMEHGINFIGIDIAYPYILEVNMDDPGGLYDARLVSGLDCSDKVAELIIDNLKICCSS